MKTIGRKNYLQRPERLGSVFSKILILGFLVVLTSCGSSPYEEAGSEQTQTILPPTVYGGTGGGDGGDTDPIISDLPNPQSYSFALNGYDDTDNVATVVTDTILKVRIRLDNGGPISVPGYGFVSTYSCGQVAVEVSGQTKISQILNTPSANPTCKDPSNGQPHPAYRDLDFSAKVANATGPFQIKIKNAQYDFYCQLWHNLDPITRNQTLGSSPNLYCPVRSVYKNHFLNGTIQIQTNSTGPLE